MKSVIAFGKAPRAEKRSNGRLSECLLAFAGGFTLLELMIVVAIMGIIATIGVPIVYRIWHKEPLRKAVADTVEVCSHARAQAILTGTITEVIIHPREGRLEVSGGGGAARPSEIPSTEFAPSASKADGSSAQFAEDIIIEDIDINKIPGGFRDADVARVRFFPNGTCDELSLIIRYETDWRQISLEVSTALASVESEARHFR